MHRVDWNLFRHFHDIVEAGSVSAAARRRNIRQPSLSAALKRLEDHLQVSLCRRTSQGIELTAAGLALRQVVTEMVDAVRLAPHLTSQAAKQIVGMLSISMISNVISPELNETLASVHRRYPAVEIKIAIDPWRVVLERVSSGECNIGITHHGEIDQSLQYEPLIRETQQLYCGRTHPLYGHRFRDATLLAPEPFILTHGDEPDDLRRFRERYGYGDRVSGHAEDLHEVSRLIELGIGIGFLPTIVAGLATPNTLWPLLDTHLLPSYFIYVITPQAARLSTPTRLFLDEVRRRLRAKHDLAGGIP